MSDEEKQAPQEEGVSLCWICKKPSVGPHPACLDMQYANDEWDRKHGQRPDGRYPDEY